MSLRNFLTIAVLAATGVLLAGQVRQLLADPTIWPPDDFVEYWAAAKLTLDGKNPFDEALLLPLQKAAGRSTEEAVMMWNPPWALPAVLPLGLLPAREAQLLWLLVQLIVTGFCADRLWLRLGGSPERRWVGWLAAFAFLPTVFALSTGQISPFLLLGAVLFLEYDCRARHDRRWEYLGGAATVLLAIKPHLAYLIWTGIAVDAISRYQWRTLVGGAVTGAFCALVPLAFNPNIWHQYADALGNRPPAQWLSPTLGSVLRLVFGAELFRLQFVSVAAGLVWFAAYRWQKRATWDWTAQLPLTLLVSFVTAPYGAWPFDMVLLLPAVFELLVKPHTTQSAPLANSTNEGSFLPSAWAVGSYRFTIVGLVAVNLGCLVMNLCQTGSFPFLWVSPAVLVLHTLSTTRSRDALVTCPEVRAAVPA